MKKDCPCGSARSYQNCCGPYHQNTQIPPTAETLMRSRYSAYALNEQAYLIQTWHPDTRPQTLDLDQSMKWFYLKILSKEAGEANDDCGVVEFEARFRVNGKAHKLKERSEFLKESGRWLYLKGE